MFSKLLIKDQIQLHQLWKIRMALFLLEHIEPDYMFLEKKLIKHYTSDIKNVISLNNNSVSVLLEDSENNIWIGTYRQELSKIAHINERIEHFIFQNDKNSIQSNMILSIIEYENDLWVGTLNGLSIYNKTDKKWSNYRNIPDNQKSLSQNDIRSLMVDNSKNIWIGTFGGGINKIAPKKILFEHIKIRERSISKH